MSSPAPAPASTSTAPPPRHPVLIRPDAETLVRDWLRGVLQTRVDADATSVPGGKPHGVGVALPSDWKARDPRGSYVALAHDGTPTVRYRGLLSSTTLRITVWAKTSTTAKALAELCMGLLLAYPGGDGVHVLLPGIGVAPSTDPATQADLASFTVRAQCRARLA